MKITKKAVDKLGNFYGGGVVATIEPFDSVNKPDAWKIFQSVYRAGRWEEKSTWSNEFPSPEEFYFPVAEFEEVTGLKFNELISDRKSEIIIECIYWRDNSPKCPTYCFYLYKDENDREGKKWDYDSPERKAEKQKFADSMRRQLVKLGYESGQIDRMFSSGGPEAAFKAAKAVEDMVQSLFIRRNFADEEKFCSVSRAFIMAFIMTIFNGVAKVGGPLSKVRGVLDIAGVSPCYCPKQWHMMKKFIAAGQLAARFISNERILQIRNDLQGMVDEAEAKSPIK
ncbi:MAG: hypothetical protein Q8Q23_02935 [bacterium]|nr:hypothetical protein [bacterium]